MKDVISKQTTDVPHMQIPITLPRKRGRPRRESVEPSLPRVQQGLLVVRKDSEEVVKATYPKLSIRNSFQEGHNHFIKKKKKYVVN